MFNRIHVDDIARVLAAAIDKDAGHRIYNVSDDEPAPPQDVVAYAAELLGVAGAAGNSFRARRGCTAWRRVSGPKAGGSSNERIRRDLGVSLLYPTYREGLRALA